MNALIPMIVHMNGHKQTQRHVTAKKKEESPAERGVPAGLSMITLCTRSMHRPESGGYGPR